jgi:hypothetical protein
MMNQRNVLDRYDPANYDITVMNLTEYMETQLINQIVVPDWIWGVQIDWAPQYGNSISIGFVFDKSIEPTLHGEAFGNGWEYRDRAYICEDDRGLCDCHYAKPLREDSKLGWVTPQEDGYGGRHFKIKMKDGRDATLRGPWHGGAPAGYHEMIHAFAKERGASNVQHSFMFGLYMKQDLFYSALSTITDELVLINSQFHQEYNYQGKMKRQEARTAFGAAKHPIPKDAWSKEFRGSMPSRQLIWRK